MMGIVIHINGTPIEVVQVTNLGGDKNGNCEYAIKYGTWKIHSLIHNRKEGAMSLAHDVLTQILREKEKYEEAQAEKTG